MRLTFISFAALLVLSVSPVLAQDAAAPPPAEEPAPLPPAPTPNPPMTGPKLLISTSMGDITLQLDSVRAPKSVANVLRYVKNGHYNGTVFYRVVEGFVIQMGSFDAKGEGRNVYAGIPLESDNGLRNLRGTVALAHTEDPNSATADFFINLANNRALNRSEIENKLGYAVFGEVTEGMDVVDNISTVPVGDNGPMPGQAPVDPILIKKVSVLP